MHLYIIYILFIYLLMSFFLFFCIGIDFVDLSTLASQTPTHEIRPLGTAERRRRCCLICIIERGLAPISLMGLIRMRMEGRKRNDDKEKGRKEREREREKRMIKVPTRDECRTERKRRSGAGS